MRPERRTSGRGAPPRTSRPPRARRARPRGNRRRLSRPPLRERWAGRLRGVLAALRARLAAVTRGRGRWLGRLGTALATAAVLVGAVAFGRLVERHLRSSPYFALRHVQVDGLNRLSEEEVREVAGLLPGRNVFELSPRRVERALRRIPWVAEVEARRRLPDGFEVRLRERRAALLALRDGTPWLVDLEGEPFTALPPGEALDLPVASGLQWARPLRLREQLQRAVALAADWRRLGLHRRARLDEIHFEPGDALVLWLGGPRVQVRLGTGGDRPRLRLLRRALDKVARERLPVRRIAVDGERRRRRVVLKLATAGS